MSIETRQEHIGRAESLLLSVPDGLRGSVIRGGIERILYATSYEFPSGYTEKVQEAALRGPLIVSLNHTSHTDFMAAAPITADIAQRANRVLPPQRRINGFVMPLALSLANGGQGKLLSMLYQDLLPMLARFGVESIPTPTENDVILKRITEEEFKRYHIASSRQVLNAVGNEGKSILIAPEGRVEGGRRNENGKIKGMQEFRKGSMHQAIRAATYKSDHATIIPIGISGGYRVYNPHGKFLTPEAFMVGLGLSFQTLMSVKVGEPIAYTKNEIKSIDPDLLDNRIGREIARLLPHEEQGFYAVAA